MIPSFLLMALLAASPSPDGNLLAAETPDSTGCALRVKGWAVALSAPEGWSVECRGPHTTNVEVALWPAGSNWREAAVVMSVSSSAPRAGETLGAFARNETLRFRSEHPTASIGVGSDLRTLDGRQALIRYFTADEFGSREAVAYLDAGPARLTFVLSSGQEPAFTAHLEAFATLVTTASVTRATK